jgi:hypothetical protein
MDRMFRALDTELPRIYVFFSVFKNRQSGVAESRPQMAEYKF